MAKFNYYLDKPNSKKETRLFLSYHFNGIRYKAPIGEKIHPDDWDKRKQRVKWKISTEDFCEDLNERLDDIEKEVKKAHLKARKKRVQFTREEILKAINPEGKVDFFKEFQKFIATRKNKVKKSTIKKDETTYNALIKFHKSTGYNVSFESLNRDFFDKFLNYLINHPDYLTEEPHVINLSDKQVGLFNNTIESYLVRLRTFMNYANEHDIADNKYHKKFKVKKDDTEVIHLDFEELEAIRNLDLSNNKKLDNVRNLFLLECYTSLRYSDIVNLKPDNVKENAILIDITTIKTTDRLKIPIAPPAQTIIKEFLKGNVRPISAQKLNNYLKELAELAGIVEPVIIIRHSGSKRVEMLFNKYELITSHVGRKTFVTLHYLAGVRTEILMAITGHKDYKHFKRYLQISEKDKAQALNDTWLKYRPELV